MFRFPTALSLLLTLSPTSGLRAQIRPGDAGFRILAKAGTVGTLCRGFSCAPFQAGVLRGEAVTLEVRGAYQGAFVVAFSAKASSCLTLPGIHHSLVLFPVIPLVVPGTMSIRDRILACPGGIGKLTFTIPKVLPPKSRFAMQALALSFGTNPGPFAFTSAILATVN